MGNGSEAELSRGDRRRNEKLRVLRAAVPAEAAIVAVDLAKAKQVVAVTGPGHQVLARRVFCCSAWGIDQVLDFAQQVANRHGLGLVVACEPTGHRWKPVAVRCRQRGLTLVCVQPLLVCRERERDDLTRDRSDARDPTLIARLARDLRCYLPATVEGPWARLRHLGARRHAKLVERTAARQQLADLLEAYWPAALEAASSLDSTTLLACLVVSTNPEEVAAMQPKGFAAAVAQALPRIGAQRRCHRVLAAFHAAADDVGKLPGEQHAAAERASFALADLLAASAAVAEVQARMLGVLDALGLTQLCCSIPGLSALGAAAILAETGDPHRYDTGRAWAKHAGICPRDNHSGAFRGQTKTSGRGRPLLRTAAWRAVWGLLPHNQVFAARYRHLTTREGNRLTDGQARAALAAALLRQLWAVLHSRTAWDPRIAAGQLAPTRHKEVATAA
jgi:transposase